MPIASSTIQAAYDAYVQKTTADTAKKPARAQLVSDARDYVEALVNAGVEFNTEGIRITKGAVFYEGGDGTLDAKGGIVSNMNPISAPYGVIAVRLASSRSIDDLIRLNAALAASLAV
jgi:hypothetical protein